MALRQVWIDGEEWPVWDVQPRARPSLLVDHTIRQGWLAMQNGNEARRIVPVPAGWERWTDAQLADAMRRAAGVPLRL